MYTVSMHLTLDALMPTLVGFYSQGANYKKILRLSYDVIITYDNRKSNVRFSCNQAPGFQLMCVHVLQPIQSRWVSTGTF